MIIDSQVDTDSLRHLHVADTAIGVMAYNEEHNIERLLRSLQNQSAAHRISRIVVVASGCTDRTPEIVQRLAEQDDRIRLICEAERSGKIAAINAFLETAFEPLLVVSCGDLIFPERTLHELLKPFDDERVGMTGAHPVPQNDTGDFVGFAVNLMWGLHDRIARKSPKMGELFAFRNTFRSLDTRALCDELSVENEIRNRGLEIRYAPAAAVINHGPTTVRQFVHQRIRWIAANLQVMDDYHLHVSTMDGGTVLQNAIAHVSEERLRLDWVAAVALIEAYCRTRAWLDYHVFKRRQKHRVWEPLQTTKHLTDALLEDRKAS